MLGEYILTYVYVYMYIFLIRCPWKGFAECAPPPSLTPLGTLWRPASYSCTRSFTRQPPSRAAVTLCACKRARAPAALLPEPAEELRSKGTLPVITEIRPSVYTFACLARICQLV